MKKLGRSGEKVRDDGRRRNRGMEGLKEGVCEVNKDMGELSLNIEW